MIKLDSIDNKILELLSEDGRESASNIADKVGLSVPATADRIKKLQDSGIIIGFKPIINSTQFPKPAKDNRVNMYNTLS